MELGKSFKTFGKWQKSTRPSRSRLSLISERAKADYYEVLQSFWAPKFEHAISNITFYACIVLERPQLATFCAK